MKPWEKAAQALAAQQPTEQATLKPWEKAASGAQETPEADPYAQEKQALIDAGIVGETASQYAERRMGLDPEIVDRGLIAPIGRTATGAKVLAMPDILVQPIKSFFLPAAAIEGKRITMEDVGDFATTFGPAALGSKGIKPTRKGIELKKEQIARALNSQQLKAKSKKGFEAFKQGRESMSPDAYADFLVNVERGLIDESMDPKLHPMTKDVLTNLEINLGDAVDPRTLVNKRRIISSNIDRAYKAGNNDDARLLGQVLDKLDMHVESLPGTNDWKNARRIYFQGIKQDMIEQALEKSLNQASGLENGLRVQIRAILNNPNKAKKFNKNETEVMKRIVRGDFTANTLKRLSKIGAGSGQQTNVLGATAAGGISGGAGAAIGGAVGGPPGAVAGGMIGASTPIIVGGAASKALEARQQRALQTLQALISGEVGEQTVKSREPARAIVKGVTGTIAASQDEETEQ